MQLQRFKTLAISPAKDFVEEAECDYKGEHYSVRDNGAIMRHARKGKSVRKSDNVWTFGTKNDTNGYMYLGSHRIHIIVATAFYGEHNSKVYVVDHIDTNRCNNRCGNLRWLTRLENALNNPVTKKKIIYLCGSIENFINDPSCLRDATGTNQDVMWMRTVTSEEAKAAYARVMEWAKKPNDENPSGGNMGEWVYQPQTVADLKLTGGNIDDTWDVEKSWEGFDEKPQEEVKEEKQPTLDCYMTSNKLAVQHGWAPYTKPEFPCCPTEVSDNPLQDYFNNLEEGKPFVVASYGPSKVYKFTIGEDILLVVTKIPNGVKSFAFTKIYWNGDVFIHKSEGTYFEENGVMADYTRAQGLEWDGPDSIDNYC